MKLPKPLIKLFDYFRTNEDQWRWYAGDDLPRDTETGAGHSIVWMIEWLYPAASEWHDNEGLEAVERGEITVKEWNDTFFEMAEKETMDSSFLRRVFKRRFLKKGRGIVDEFAILRYGTLGVFKGEAKHHLHKGRIRL